MSCWDAVAQTLLLFDYLNVLVVIDDTFCRAGQRTFGLTLDGVYFMLFWSGGLGDYLFEGGERGIRHDQELRNSSFGAKKAAPLAMRSAACHGDELIIDACPSGDGVLGAGFRNLLLSITFIPTIVSGSGCEYGGGKG